MKKRDIRLPAKAGVWYVCASAAIKLGGMAATPIFTGAMSKEEYGKYALYMSWIAILSVVSTLGLSGGVIYRGMQKFKDRQDELVSSALGLALLSLTVFAIISIIWRERISAITGLEDGLISLLFLQMTLDAAVALYTARCRYLYGYRGVIAINVASALLSLGASILLVLLFRPTADVRVLALFFSTLVFALPLLIIVIFKGRKLYSREIWGFLLKFNLPLLPYCASSAILANVDKVMISGIAGGASLAKYAVAHSLGVGMTFVTGGLGSALQPWIMRKVEAGRERRVADVSLKVTLIVAIGALAILTLAPEVFSFLAPDSYSDAIVSVYPITLSAIISFISSVASAGILHAERTGLLSLSALVGAAVNIAANLILLPHSYNGAAFSLLLASAVSTAVAVFASMRIMRAPIVRLLPSVGIFAVSALIAAMLYALRENMLPRIAILLALSAIGLVALIKIKRDVTE